MGGKMSSQTTAVAFANAVKAGKNCFLTGGGGVGKTYLINLLRDKIKTVFHMTATTGLAALHLNGQTIHSFTGMGVYTDVEDLKKIKRREGFFDTVQKLRDCKILVIDECSMMRPDQFDLLDALLRFVMTTDEEGKHLHKLPFGGVQIILVGDLLQLPPVIMKNDNLEHRWLFQTKAWKDAEFETYHLTEVKRQNNLEFINVLNDVRFGIVTHATNLMFHGRMNIENDAPIRLMSKNADVDILNDESIKKVEGEFSDFIGHYSYHYELDENTEANIKERRSLFYQLNKSINISPVIKLKPNCRVLICKNDMDGEYVNGSMGTFIKAGYFIDTRIRKYQEVEDALRYVGIPFEYEDEHDCFLSLGEFDDDKIETLGRNLKPKGFKPCLKLQVMLDNGNQVYIGKNDYSIKTGAFYNVAKKEVEDDVTFSQYPIRLGYAITIHKSQGMTLESVEIDFDGMFACGQAYVALSRARSLEGLFIKNWKSRYVNADPEAVEFYNNLEE
jgi:hypothetical protein